MGLQSYDGGNDCDDNLVCLHSVQGETKGNVKMAKQKACKMAPVGMVYVITDCIGRRQGRYSGYGTISSARGAATRMERKLWAIYDAWTDANSGPSNKRMIDAWVVYRIGLAPMASYNPMA